MPRSPKIAIEPQSHPWAESITAAVSRSDVSLVPAADAEALIWLGKGGDDLREYLHDGIRWVQLRAAGVEHWIATGEIDEARDFTSARGAYARSVGEHAIAVLFAAAKRLHISARATSWDTRASEGVLLAGSTVGIVGAGGIGQEVIRFLEPFDVEIIAVTRSGRTVEGASQSLPAADLAQMWPKVDYALILAPATAETEALVGREQFAAMQPSAWILNLARGSLVDGQALIEALDAGSIAGAVLDVTDPEPLPDDHPLWGRSDVVITPHVANPGPEQLPLLIEHILDNVDRFANGRDLLARIDIGAGY